MSRIGKKPIPVPSGVKVNLDPKSRTVAIEGPRGKLAYEYRPEVSVVWDESEKKIVCSIPEDRGGDRSFRAHWGTVRARIRNMIIGVTGGFQKKLEIIGVGWGAQAQGKSLRLNVGYCHPVDMQPPDGVEFDVKGQVITVSGPEKQTVCQFAPAPIESVDVGDQYAESGDPDGLLQKYGLTPERIVEAAKKAVSRK